MGYEDFTTYTEGDTGGYLSVAANVITATAMPYNAEAWVKKDYGANHFEDFEHLHKAVVTESELYCYAILWGLTTNDATRTGHEFNVNADGIVICIQNNLSANVRIHFATHLAPPDSYQTASTTGTFYFTTKRAGTVGTCKIYSDAARTNLLDTLTVTLPTTKYRYLIAMASRESAGTEAISCTSENLDLQEKITYEPSDAIGISDSTLFEHRLNFSDTINIDDDISIKRILILADILNINDTILIKRLFNLDDSVNIIDSTLYKHLINIADNIAIDDGLIAKRLLSLIDTISINDEILFKHGINLFDQVNISDATVIAGIISDILSILDSVSFHMTSICGELFNLHSSAHDMYLPMPDIVGEAGSLNNKIKLFDFWTDERDTINIGIADEPIILSGTIYACTDNEEQEMAAIAVTFLNIHAAATNHEEITITGLGDCFDAVYLIKNFRYNTIRRSPYAYTWQLTLEYVRAI